MDKNIKTSETNSEKKRTAMLTFEKINPFSSLGIIENYTTPKDRKVGIVTISAKTMHVVGNMKGNQLLDLTIHVPDVTVVERSWLDKIIDKAIDLLIGDGGGGGGGTSGGGDGCTTITVTTKNADGSTDSTSHTHCPPKAQ